MNQPSPIPTSSTVAANLPCVRCGYNLRTLSADGRCPECATPVALTTSLGRDLAQTRPAYVRRLAWACWLLLAARCMLLAVVLGPFVAPYGASFLPISSKSLAALFLLSGISLTALLLPIGAWLLTGREHPQFPSEMPRTTLAIRILPLIGCIALTPVISNELSSLLASFSIFISPIIRSMDLLRILLWVSVLIYSLYPAVEMRLMVHLSRRLANASLGRRALVTGIGASVGGLGCFVIITLMLTFPSLNFTSYTNAMGYSFGFAMALTLVCWLWTAFSCLIAARSFARAAVQATRHWSAHGTGEAPQ